MAYERAPIRKLDIGICVGFDLDDTLYDEVDYVRSGFDAVADFIGGSDGEVARTFLATRLRERTWMGALDALAAEFGQPALQVRSWLDVYRSHEPKISLRPGLRNLLDRLRRLRVPLACITDGRSLTQRLKLNGLGVLHYFSPLLISEEVGCAKPSAASFLAVQEHVGASRYWYIGDNPRKDFLAPNHLGWWTVGLANPRAIRTQDMRTHELGHEGMPHEWADSVLALSQRLEVELRGAT